MDRIKFKKYDKRSEKIITVEVCNCGHNYVPEHLHVSPNSKNCKICMCSNFEKVCEMTWEEYKNSRNDVD
jgi:hypothetical protein